MISKNDRVRIPLLNTSFILGLPGENKNTIMKTIDFSIELDPDYATFSLATPYPGTEFYDTIKEIKFLKWLYRKEDAKTFDIYDAGTKGTFFFTNFLRWLHNGILPTYLVWCLIGMIMLFFVIMR